MSMPKYAGRRDANESDLLKAARLLGAMWEQQGPLDGWLLWRGVWTPVEIKTSKGTYTDAQVLFLARCKERNAPVWTLRTVEDVYRHLGAIQTA